MPEDVIYSRTEIGGETVRVLFQIRPDFMKNLAGDSIQLLNTKKHLERLGIRVDISSSFAQQYKGYDLVHLFNLTRVVETYAYAYKAYEYGMPIVLSTIYWNNSYYYEKNELPDWKKKAWHQQDMLRRIVISKAAMLLPNSIAEAEMILKDFGVSKPYRIIPNCVDKKFSCGVKSRFVERYGIEDYVLCVGRISPRKNQLALIEALKDTDFRLVLIGPVNDREYEEKCLKAADEKVLFIPGQNIEQLRDSYAAAAVHALPSWLETPGLANLEAAAAGCEIVTTRYGSAYEYFGDLANYCLPEDIASIKEGVYKAADSNNGERLKELVLSEYSWEKAARKTLEAYREVLDE